MPFSFIAKTGRKKPGVVSQTIFPAGLLHCHHAAYWRCFTAAVLLSGVASLPPRRRLALLHCRYAAVRWCFAATTLKTGVASLPPCCCPVVLHCRRTADWNCLAAAVIFAGNSLLSSCCWSCSFVGWCCLSHRRVGAASELGLIASSAAFSITIRHGVGVLAD
jgi:hypothetical protein